MSKTIKIQFDGSDSIYPISIKQTSPNMFVVRYGLQTEKCDCFRAADELGECIMHALECASLIERNIKD